jgi:hypothetical protein
MYERLRKKGATHGGWWYWRDNHGTLHDFNGPFQAIGDNELLAVDEVAASWDKLDWSETALCQPTTSTAGWLSPSGEFLPCPSNQHDRYARYVLHVKVGNLEKGGWARIYSSATEAVEQNRRAHDAWCCLRAITPEQRAWLENHEHEVRDYD